MAVTSLTETHRICPIGSSVPSRRPQARGGGPQPSEIVLVVKKLLVKNKLLKNVRGQRQVLVRQ